MAVARVHFECNDQMTNQMFKLGPPATKPPEDVPSERRGREHTQAKRFSLSLLADHLPATALAKATGF